MTPMAREREVTFRLSGDRSRAALSCAGGMIPAIMVGCCGPPPRVAARYPVAVWSPAATVVDAPFAADPGTSSPDPVPDRSSLDYSDHLPSPDPGRSPRVEAAAFAGPDSPTGGPADGRIPYEAPRDTRGLAGVAPAPVALGAGELEALSRRDRSGSYYEVRSGDSLAGIARRFRVSTAG